MVDFQVVGMPATAKVASSTRVELLRRAPKNAWVALSSDETQIVAVAETFMEADALAKKSGQKDYFLVRTPDEWVSRVFMPK
jgi:hypothetical protein